jgi:hypothetical protein
MPPGAVAFGDSFIWAEATSGEMESKAAKRAVEQTRSARIDEILERIESGATVVGFGRRLKRRPVSAKKKAARRRPSQH